MWYLVMFVVGAVMGAVIYRAVIDGLMLAQQGAHEKEKEFMWEELHRLRAQVALHIGKE